MKRTAEGRVALFAIASLVLGAYIATKAFESEWSCVID
jgi:hypothetical protein